MLKTVFQLASYRSYNVIPFLLVLLTAACGTGELHSEGEDYEEIREVHSTPCGFDDGTYSASVEYYNPDTGHSASYTLDVEVSDCQVIQINFPNGGWLDDSHIDAADLNDDGSAYVEDDKGREFEIHVDR